ncbi:hypothetical protein CYLTODRAFT_426356 [Cylindrobasidium torrendii FP15055 ss-10]|uniref:Uncharacterized protein n=1 Tax=Cylindrobasidium torrendii FP15055 ss-10 TaxID=1314674 RepID=A0A0D7AXP2_9AGAR|nr:hypothetical protein CYLTODRAFT_426356 [Cylindrobasidium torrendii FP15055 ss-10]
MGRALYSTAYAPAASPALASPSPPTERVRMQPPALGAVPPLDTTRDSDTESDTSRSSSPDASPTSLDTPADSTHTFPSRVLVVGEDRAAANPVRSSSPDILLRELGIGTWDTHKFDPDSEEFWADAVYEAVSSSAPVVQDPPAPTENDNTTAPAIAASASTQSALVQEVDIPVTNSVPAPRFSRLAPTGWHQMSDLAIWTRDIPSHGHGTTVHEGRVRGDWSSRSHGITTARW